MSENSIERRFKSGVEALGGRCIKMGTRAETGLPDRMVLLPGRRVEFVELKAPTGTLRPAQKRVRGTLSALGFHVFVLHTNPLVDQWLAWLAEEVKRG